MHNQGVKRAKKENKLKVRDSKAKMARGFSKDSRKHDIYI